MRRWLAFPLAALLMAGCMVPPYTSGGPIGGAPPRRSVPASQEPSPATGYEPGQILVRPAPGQTLEDLQRRFGAENVRPFAPEGMDDSLRLEFGLDQWYVIIVPEGSELGGLSGLIEDGAIVDGRLVPKGQRPPV
ncbi:MAG: hypothetical protein K6U89_15115 [Chloroflexi bacterium]|nr:hypothetical protein [Chloroflexota bacterium]